MSERTARVGDLDIVYEELGDPDGEPLLLVMGLGMQLIHWDRELCDMLGARGFRLIRFDNRDAGRSSQVDARVPGLMRGFVGLRVGAPYLLSDMAADAFGVLDHLGIERAHVMGASMGGMIAQEMALGRPERVLSLASVMSTTGERWVGLPKLRALGLLFRRAPRDRDAYVEYFVRVFQVIGSPGFDSDEDRIRELAAASYDRGYHRAGTARQLAAIMDSPDRTARLRELRVPTVVVHGRRDPLVPFRAGRATAAAIPDARMLAIDGMGHDLPRETWPRIVEAVADNAARAAEAAPA